MGELYDINVLLDEKEIVRLLGYKSSQPENETIQRVKEEIKNSNKYIVPHIYFKKINIKEIKEEKVILENGVVFEGKFIAEKLSKCSYIITCITTLGDKIDIEINKAFEQDDSLRGLIIDSIGTVAVEYVNKMFWNMLIKEIQGSAIGITARFSPGNKGWKLTEQQKIFHCIEGENVKVKLLEASFMIPMKSTSYIYGFGENIEIARVDHICCECSMKNCSYRK